MRFWIDVEDLFEYGRKHTRPSGIQRVAFELILALEARPDLAGRIGYLRHDARGRSFRHVPAAGVMALYERLTSSDQASCGHVETSGPPRAAGRLRVLATRLPTDIRVPLGTLLRDQMQAMAAAGRLVSGTFRTARGIVENARHDAGHGTTTFEPECGDVILAFGAPWAHAYYGEMLQSCKERFGVRAGLLVHDVIPLLFPEWLPPGLGRVFGRWYDAVLPVCDHVFAVSRATQRDIQDTARLRDLAMTAPVSVMPMGTLPRREAVKSRSPLAGLHGGTAFGYVLVVGTIEARKNHAAMLRIWRRLLKERPKDTVPKLVFAGRPGWLVDDLLQQIRNSDYLDGHIIIVHGPTDEEIDALYRDALMTVVPSFYEGWGLPVSESQARGTLCVVSSTPALLEAAGPDAPHFDPDNVTDGVQVIEALLDAPDRRRNLKDVMQANYVPTPWSSSAQAILSVFGSGS